LHPEREFAVRWHERIFYPGPAWYFNVPKWVEDIAVGRPAKPTLTAWWCDAETNLAATSVFSLTPPGNTTNLPRDCRIEGHKGRVTIESIRVEDHPIEVFPDAPTTEPCLVVRLEFPKDNLFIVDPGGFKGLNAIGKALAYEHRLYTEASKYTGLFWPINQDELNKLSSLSMLSMNALRVEAIRQKNSPEEIKLSQPRPEDQVPEPPVVKVN
jgi:hypothetical protein